MLDQVMRQIQLMPDGQDKDELIKQLYQDYPGQEKAITEALTAGESEAGTAMPEGYSAGGQFVADQMGSSLAAGLRQGLGAWQQQKGIRDLKDLAKQRGAGLQGVAGMELGQNAPPVSTALRNGGGGYSGPATGQGSGEYASLMNEYGTDKMSPQELGYIARAESSNNPNAVSPAGAVGLMQFMPGTAKDMGITDRRDPRQSVRGARDYMTQQLDAFGGDMRLANAAYNWGPGNVRKARKRYGSSFEDFLPTN